jgi:hypothetical protein
MKRTLFTTLAIKAVASVSVDANTLPDVDYADF